MVAADGQRGRSQEKQKNKNVKHGRNVLGHPRVGCVGVGTVLRLERDAWLMLRWLGQALPGCPSPRPTQTMEMSPLGVGTVLRLEMDAWSMVK